MLGKKIAELRRAQKMTRRKLARRANTSPSTVRNWEQNDNQSTNSVILKIYYALNVEPNTLFGYDTTNSICADNLTAEERQALNVLIQSMQNKNMQIEKLQSKKK